MSTPQTPDMPTPDEVAALLHASIGPAAADAFRAGGWPAFTVFVEQQAAAREASLRAAAEVAPRAAVDQRRGVSRRSLSITERRAALDALCDSLYAQFLEEEREQQVLAASQ